MSFKKSVQNAEKVRQKNVENETEFKDIFARFVKRNFKIKSL